MAEVDRETENGAVTNRARGVRGGPRDLSGGEPLGLGPSARAFAAATAERRCGCFLSRFLKTAHEKKGERAYAREF